MSTSICQCKMVPPLHLRPQTYNNYNNEIGKGEVLEFDQLIDHSNPDLGTFKMQYYIDTTNYKSGGQLHLIIGEEGPMNLQIPLVDQGPIYQWSIDNNALQVMPEHRYYGLSFPTNNLTITGLKYLTIDQALDDLKYFASYIQTKYNIKGITMLFGCSYPGALAAWSKIKYPQFWDAAIVGSGVVNPIISYSTYFNWYNDGFSKYSIQCLINFQTAATYIINQLTQTEQGRIYLTETFQFCSVLPSEISDHTSEISQQFLFALMAAIPAQWDSGYSNFPLQQTCNLVDGKNTINQTIKIWSELMNSTLNGKCYDINNNIGQFNLTEMKRTSIPTVNEPGPLANSKAWGYQVCTQLGTVFATINSGSTIFGNNGLVQYEYLSKICKNMGIDIPNWTEPDVKYLLNTFGGGNVSQMISNAFFSFGHYDPWRFTYTNWVNPNGENNILWEHDEAHCGVFYPYSNHDTQSIKNERELISYWLRQFN